METTQGHPQSSKYKSVNPQDNTDDITVQETSTATKLIVLIVGGLGWILFIIFMILYILEVDKHSDSSNCNTTSASTDDANTLSPSISPSEMPSMSPTKSSLPKNLIIIISDGMGQTYNTAYRTYKNISKTTMDKYFKGRYSTAPANPDAITDSAAGATAFALGVPTQNQMVGLDSNGNPHGSILAAAKRQGKGTGLIATKSVTGN